MAAIPLAGILARGRLFSSHVVLDEEDCLGRVWLYEHYFRFSVWHRWSGAVFLDWGCSRSAPAWGQLMPDWRVHVAKFVRRYQDDEKGSLTSGKADTSGIAEKYPALAEHLSLDWIDGGVRTTSTLTLTVDGGRWRASLRDRDNGVVCWVTGDTFDGTLGLLERGIVDGSLDWRVDQYAPARRGGKRKP